MIASLYKPFQHWAQTGSVYIFSDPHFEDEDCKYMDPNWITPKEQIDIINKCVLPSDTFICLGDVGNPSWIGKIKAKKKILILGNHDVRKKCEPYFDEIYSGPLFISNKILLSHEPIPNLPWCLNIHGHDHADKEEYTEGCRYINLAANKCNYTPASLGKIIKNGAVSGINDIHEYSIIRFKERYDKKESGK